MYGQPNTQSRLQSETADNVLWARYTQNGLEKDTARPLLRAALSQIAFEETSSPVPLQALIQRMEQLHAAHKRVIVVTGRSRRLVAESHHQEMKVIAQKYGYVGGGTSGDFELTKKTIGDVGCALLVSGSGSPNAMVVVQAEEVQA